MMPRLSFLSLIVMLLLALGSIAVACGDGGKALSLEEYFQRLEAINDDVEERSDAVDEEYQGELEAASTDEEEVEALRDFFDAFLSTSGDALDDLKHLNPPAEAEGLHNDLVGSLSETLELLREFARRLDDVDSRSEAEDVWDDEFEDQGDDISERLDDACVNLQDLADENEIDVDLECEGGVGTGAGQEARPSPTPRDVEVVSYNTYQSEFGSVTVSGEVVNNGNAAVQLVEVIVTLTDAAGDVVATDSGYTVGPGILEPGGTAPFSVLILDAPSE